MILLQNYSSDSVTIIIVSVTIMTVITKKTIAIVDMWLQACAFDIISSQYIHNHVKIHAKMVSKISDEINLDKELKLFSWRALKMLYESTYHKWKILGICIQI